MKAVAKTLKLQALAGHRPANCPQAESAGRRGNLCEPRAICFPCTTPHIASDEDHFFASDKAVVGLRRNWLKRIANC